jgi:hypothetical protein
MAHAFQPIPGKPAFGNITPTQYAGDYTKNKVARMIYCRDKKTSNCKKRYSQCELLTYNKGLALSRYGFCSGVSPLNYSDLTAGLYTQSNLQNVAVVSEVLDGIVPTTIDPCVCPFYSYYNIDPKGELFGNTACGINNFTSYMTLESNTLPPPPTNLSVTLDSTSVFFSPELAEGETCSVIFSWQPPINNGGSLISGYVVNYYPQDDEESFINISNIPSTDVSIVITDIPIPSTYVFQVAAVNLTGQGAYQSIIYTTPTSPSAPTITSAVPGYEQVTLSWTAPSDGGTPITSYDISYNDGSISLNYPTSSTIITSLTNGQLYNFQVAAVNVIGSSPYSEVVSATPNIPAGPPIDLLCSKTFNPFLQSLTYNFSWSPPDTGGLPIISYTFNYQQLDVLPPITSDITINNIQTESYSFTIYIYDMSVYGFQVAAVNSVGQGPYAPFQIDAPTDLIATPGILSVSLSWTAPMTGGMPVIEYTIEDSFDQLTWSQIGTSPTPSYDATGLLPNILYYFRVAAVNAVSTSPYSEVVSATPTNIIIPFFPPF